jgi:signal transduction histidine kinase
MQLTQLFQNLIGNAIKFNRGKNPVIEISAIRDGGLWQFSVRDNGPGIPEEHRDRVFQIFQRLEPRQGGVEGTGIGLAVCRRIVERHGGEISVYGREGGGAEFRFTISAEEKP